MIRYVGAVNDTYDWFLLADVANINHLKEQRNLGTNLLEVLTTTEIGDMVAAEGILIPLMGIDNLPYTIVFNVNEPSTFTQAGLTPTHQQDGYVIEIISGQITLFTVPYLIDWSAHSPRLLAATSTTHPCAPLANGWYRLQVNVGDMHDEDCSSVIEFCLQPVAQAPEFSADVNYQFALE